MGNPVCDLLAIRYPILLGGMLQVGRAPLAAAVSRAGGLGILGAGRMRPDDLEEEIKKIREMTSHPFGLNIPLRSPKAENLVRLAAESRVSVVTTSAGNPATHTHFLKSKGVKVLHVVATVGQALKAKEAGVDAVVAEGGESGGFLGKDRVSTLVLVPQVADALDIPVIAAGGIADGRGMAAAFALGAVGIQMGTRFLAAAECRISSMVREALLLAADTDTMVLQGKSGANRRVLKNELMDAAREALEKAAGSLVKNKELNRRFESTQYQAAGQCAGLIKEILPAKDIIHKILAQAREVYEALSTTLPQPGDTISMP